MILSLNKLLFVEEINIFKPMLRVGPSLLLNKCVLANNFVGQQLRWPKHIFSLRHKV